MDNNKKIDNIELLLGVDNIAKYILDELMQRMRDGCIKNNRKYMMQLYSKNKKINKLQYVAVSFIVNIDVGDDGFIYLDLQYGTDFRKLGKFAGLSYRANNLSIDDKKLYAELYEVIKSDISSSLSNFDKNMDIYLELTNWG